MYNFTNLTNTLNRFVEEGTLIGCGMQVISDDRVVYNHVTGNATLDGRLPLTEDTRLRLYSVSKTFTIAGFLKLYEKGFFSLDDPVSRYLPEFSHPVVCLSKEDISQVEPAKRPITIRHLLTMTSGIPYMGLSLGAGLVEDAYYEKIDNMLAKVRQGEQYRLKDFVRMIADIPLCFHPGEQWMYGFSHAVIGRLTEVLSGKSLGQYLKSEIWEPLGLSKTCFNIEVPKTETIADQIIFENVCHPLGQQAETHERTAQLAAGTVYGSKEDIMPLCTSGIEVPCAGMVSTMRDLGQFVRMLSNGGSYEGQRILGQHTLNLARSDHLNSCQLKDFTQWENNRGFTYGLGYRTFRSCAEAGFYLPEGSFGWDGATGCYLIANLKHRFGFVFVEQSMPHHIAYTIPRIVAALNSECDLY